MRLAARPACLGIAAVAAVLLGAITGGCHSTETASDPSTANATMAAVPAPAASAVTAVQNDPNMPPALKARLASQFESTAGRPPGAPAAPIAGAQ
jgi:hypothetical protein